MLEFYDMYMNNMAKSPNELWRTAQQELVNQIFDNTTIQYTIEEENMPFDFKFNKIDAWVDTVTEATLMPDKDDSDYKEIYFRDCTHQSSRGRYYRFQDNYWIVYSDPCIEDATASQRVRRCNNWLKWVDRDTGILYEYPCVIDYNLSSTNAQTSRIIQQANSHITVIVQGNENTLKINKNARFIFNGIGFRFFAVNNYMQNDYVNRDTPILFYDFYEDMVIDDDNLEENIADDFRKDYHITTDDATLSCLPNATGCLNCKAYRNNEQINTQLEYISSDNSIVKIDNSGNYSIVGSVGDEANITVRIKNNELSATNVTIKIVNPCLDDFHIVVDDFPQTISQGDTIVFTAYLYNNNTKLDDTVQCTPNWSDKHYDLRKIADNKWQLTNNAPCGNILNLTFACTSKNIETTKSIRLTAMW